MIDQTETPPVVKCSLCERPATSMSLDVIFIETSPAWFEAKLSPGKMFPYCDEHSREPETVRINHNPMFA